MALNATERVLRHRDDIPRKYRRLYDKAVSGKSMKAAIHIFCLDCCGYRKEEVRDCSSPECSLFPYRPYVRISPSGDKGHVARETTPNSTRRALGQGQSKIGAKNVYRQIKTSVIEAQERGRISTQNRN